MTLKPFSDSDQPRSRAMPRRAMLWSLLPVKWTRWVPHAAGGQTMRSTCGPSRSTMLDLSVPADEDLLDLGQAVQRADERRGLVDRGEQVEVADRRLPPPQRPCRLDATHAAHVAQALDEVREERIGVVDEQAGAAALDPRDALQDVLLGARGQPLDVPESARFGGGAQPSSESMPRASWSSRTVRGPTPGHPEHVEQAVGNLRA